MLVDDVTITIKAGDGGNGAATFKRNAQTPKGGPDGGNGGNGGNVYFIGSDDLNGLSQFRYKKEHQAEKGVNGARQNLYGRNGEHLYIKVPVGTRITEIGTGRMYEITDKTTPVLLAKGGKGGRGNNEFKTSILQAPKFAEDGEEGEGKELRLELRMIADIGFIGLPNAGKSSLLQALTNAHPKIGNYPFTTLEPNIGMMIVNSQKHQQNQQNQLNQIADTSDASDFSAIRHTDTSRNTDVSGMLALADIPGLIEGASSGKGLGIKFLKHIEKTKLLVHCIDGTDPDPLKTYHTVRAEFEQYNKALLDKPEIILLTKTDLITKEEAKQKTKQLTQLKKEVISVTIYDPASLSDLRSYLTAATNANT